MAPLEKRLAKLWDWCQPYPVVADIGAGQGRLARALANEGHRVFATEKTVKGWHELRQYTRNFDGIVPLLGDGLEPILDSDVVVDVAVVAGMGPKVIERILQQDASSHRVRAFMVQPMQGLFVLRRYLKTAAWFVRRADLVHERGRLYGMWWVVRNCDENSSPFSEWIPTEFLGSPRWPELIRQRIHDLDQKLRYQDARNELADEWQQERHSLLGMLR